MTKCIAPNCEEECAVESALCVQHKRKLDTAEKEVLSSATKAIARELRQFERLMYVEPPLRIDEIAHRMVWTEDEVRKVLKRFKDHRV